MHPWLIGLKAIIFAAAWFALITLVFIPHPGVAPWIPLAAGPIWALLSFLLVRYWSAARGWRDHRFALSFGTVLGCMVPSDLSAAGWTRTDLIAKFVFQVLAVAGFLLLARTVWRREAAEHVLCH